MDPSHAVDIYVDLAASEAMIVRRRDLNWLHGCLDARTIASGVSEGLDPKRSHRHVWQSDPGSWDYESEDIQIVVVWRQNHQTIIGTPYCPWGKAPDIVLDESPRFSELGEAIIAQANFSAAAKSRRANST
jgi:hypothetical protein